MRESGCHGRRPSAGHRLAPRIAHRVQVPDVDAVIHFQDLPIADLEHYAKSAPVFSYTGGSNFVDVPFPDWAHWGNMAHNQPASWQVSGLGHHSLPVRAGHAAEEATCWCRSDVARLACRLKMRCHSVPASACIHSATGLCRCSRSAARICICTGDLHRLAFFWTRSHAWQGQTADPNEGFIQGWDATRDYLLHSGFLHPLERRTPALFYRCWT